MGLCSRRLGDYFQVLTMICRNQGSTWKLSFKVSCHQTMQSGQVDLEGAVARSGRIWLLWRAQREQTKSPSSPSMSLSPSPSLSPSFSSCLPLCFIAPAFWASQAYLSWNTNLISQESWEQSRVAGSSSGLVIFQHNWETFHFKIIVV